MIAALLLDLDGVLRRWPAAPVTAAELAAGLPPGAIMAAAFQPGRLLPALRGEITDAAWRAQVAAALDAGVPIPRPAIAAAVETWSAAIGEVDPDVLALVRAVRRKLPVVLVSNATTRLRADLAALGLADAVDAIISSAEVGAAKPHPAIFTAALTAAGVPAARALFVDDDPRNVTAAVSLGLQGHHFTTASALRAALAHAGVRTAVDA